MASQRDPDVATALEHFSKFDDNRRSIDVAFILISAALVFLTQAGFAMLTVGSIRTKNAKNVLLKNILDACVGTLAFFLFGWSLAFGPDGNAFFGWGQFALSPSSSGDPVPLHIYLFSWAFAATATTIVSGAVAERCSFIAYLFYAFYLTAFVYPIVAHWVWADNGWLRTLYGTGVVDFAGGMVVHVVGGFSALAGSVIIGPRLGRFDSDGGVVPIPGHSATLATLGTFLLWFGWYGFNPGSVLGISNVNYREAAGRAAVNTTLSASASAMTVLGIVKLRSHIFDLPVTLNGILAGLVSVTACCPFIEPWVAILVGTFGGATYTAISTLVLYFHVDDPLDSFAIHGACGAWGVIAGALFNRGELHAKLGRSGEHFGLLRGGGFRLLAANLTGVIVIATWTLGLLGALFFALKKLDLLRISPHEELIGNDVSKHGGVAYPIDTDISTERVNYEHVESVENALIDLAKAPLAYETSF